MLNKILQILYFVSIYLMFTGSSWSKENCLKEISGKHLGGLYYYDKELGKTTDGDLVG